MTDFETLKDEFEAWCERTGWDYLGEAYNDQSTVIAVDGAGREINIDKYGNVYLTKHTHLGGENGHIDFNDKRIVVTDERGDQHYLSTKEFPI